VDIVTRRGDQTLYAEVKGRTSGWLGAGLDTLYGQLLRRNVRGKKSVTQRRGLPL
jgi:hypothetical protein